MGNLSTYKEVLWYTSLEMSDFYVDSYYDEMEFKEYREMPWQELYIYLMSSLFFLVLALLFATARRRH
jgi:hypothetical protein